jgi:hypothetical protein
LPLFPDSKRNFAARGRLSVSEMGRAQEEARMNGLIYLVGLIVVIMAVLSLFGLR